MSYIVPPKDGSEIFYSIRGGAIEGNNIEREQREVFIEDLRLVDGESFSLREHGFQLEKLVVPDDVDWTDDNQVRSWRYYVRRATASEAFSGVSSCLGLDATFGVWNVFPPTGDPSVPNFLTGQHCPSAYWSLVFLLI